MRLAIEQGYTSASSCLITVSSILGLYNTVNVSSILSLYNTVNTSSILSLHSRDSFVEERTRKMTLATAHFCV